MRWSGAILAGLIWWVGAWASLFGSLAIAVHYNLGVLTWLLLLASAFVAVFFIVLSIGDGMNGCDMRAWQMAIEKHYNEAYSRDWNAT